MSMNKLMKQGALVELQLRDHPENLMNKMKYIIPGTIILMGGMNYIYPPNKEYIKELRKNNANSISADIPEPVNIPELAEKVELTEIDQLHNTYSNTHRETVITITTVIGILGVIGLIVRLNK